MYFTISLKRFCCYLCNKTYVHRLSADFLLPHIHIYTSGFVSLQLVHVSTHKKYRFYQSLTQIKKRSNCFGNPKQKKSETSTTLWGHWHSRPMGKWWYDLPCKQKRHHLFKKWNRRSRFVSYLNFTVCDICIWCGAAAHIARYKFILPSI